MRCAGIEGCVCVGGGGDEKCWNRGMCKHCVQYLAASQSCTALSSQLFPVAGPLSWMHSSEMEIQCDFFLFPFGFWVSVVVFAFAVVVVVVVA